MFLSVLIILVCICLVLVILIQNSKGGGIQSQFGAATQIMGVKRGTEVIEKLTWGFAIVLIVLSIAMTPKSATNTTPDEESGSVAKRKAAEAAAPVQQPTSSQPAAPLQTQPNP